MVLVGCPTIFPCLFVLFPVKTEDILDQIDWKNKMNQSAFPKYWIGYVHKALDTTLHKCAPGYQVADCLSRFNTKSFAFCAQASRQVSRRHKVQSDHNHFETEATLVSPTITIDLFSCAAVYQQATSFKSFILVFLFDLHANLRLNLTFKRIHIVDFYGDCYLTYLQIDNPETTKFTYCGVHSNFSLFPQFVNVIVRLSYCYGRIPLDVLANCQVLSSNILSSLPPSRTNSELIQQMPTYHLPFHGINMLTYNIQVQKYQQIKMSLNFSPTMATILLYSGTGYFSEKREITLNWSGIIFSYQCYMQLILTQNVTTSDVLSVATFGGVAMPVTHVSLQPEKEHSVSFPYSCELYNYICILHLHSVEKFINFTIQSLTHVGEPSTDCSYGGVFFFDIEKVDFQETLFLCNKYNTHYSLVPQSIFSHNFSALVVMCHLKRYSELKTTAVASLSHCPGVSIDACLENTIRTAQPITILHHSQHFQVTQLHRDISLKLAEKSCLIVQMFANQYKRKISKGKNKMLKDCIFVWKLDKDMSPEQLWSFEVTGILKSQENKYRNLVDISGTEYNKTINILFEEGNGNSILISV